MTFTVGWGASNIIYIMIYRDCEECDLANSYYPYSPYIPYNPYKSAHFFQKIFKIFALFPKVAHFVNNSPFCRKMKFSILYKSISYKISNKRRLFCGKKYKKKE